MAGDGLPIERLRDYLRELKPEARAMLIGELERGLLRSEEVPGTDLVLRELRRGMREAGQVARIGNPARLFFRPFEPFLVDDGPDHRHRSRIARPCLELMWGWLSRDVIPEETKRYCDEVSQALLADNPSLADGLARTFQDRAVAAMSEAFSRVRADPKAMNRLTLQLGSKRAATDLESAIIILRNREAFETFGSRLPTQVKNLAEPQLSQIKTALESPPLSRPELLPYGLVLVMNRLAAPWQLIRFTIRAVESDVTARLAATPYAVAINIALDEIERMVSELRTELKSGQGIAVVALLKNIHDAARGLRSEIDLSSDSPWSRQLAAVRTEVSSLVKSEVESMPGRVRRLLRPPAAGEIAPGQTLDPQDVVETQTLIGFVDACRHFAGELAINEMTLRAFSEVQRYLDDRKQALLDGLRSATDRDRPYRLSQVDAAVSFCATIFGRDYASVLSKAAEVAATAERKAARA
jgi:hypothetical protein